MSYDVLSPEDARLWPYQPDWSRGYIRRRAYSTDIIATRNATEQRRALRSIPRLSADYSTIVADAERRRADHHMRAWQNKGVIVPDWARYTLTTGGTLIAGTALTISPVPAWVTAGQPLVLCGASGMEVAIVATVVGSTVNLEDPVAAAWPSGSVVRPTFFGLFEAQTRSARITKGTASIEITISAYPGGEPASAAGSAWASFNGYEVFTLQPDYVAPPSVDYVWPVEQIDYGRGRTAQFRPIDRANRALEADFKGLDIAGIEELEQFFDRMKGRRGAFYMPTWEKDFALAASEPSGSASFLADGPELAADFASADFDDTWAIAVCLTSGAHIYRLVTGIAAGTGPETGDSRVTVSAAWGTAISTANVARISWMPLWRFDNDEMASVYSSPLSASARLTYQTVPPAPLPEALT